MTVEVTYDRNTMEPIFVEVPDPVPNVEPQVEKQKTANVQATGDGKVSIIVLCLDQVKYTKICIESIREHTQRGRYQLIVVDNGSSNETLGYLVSILTEPEHIIIRNPNNRGFSAGNNQALRLAEYEYVLFLNNDCMILRDDWLDVIIRAEDNADLIGASCMKVRVDAGNKRFVHVGMARESEQWSYLEGWCLFGRTELFQRLEGFDMRFNPAYSEDADMSFRVRRMGLKIKAVGVPIQHFGHKTESVIRGSLGNQSDISNKRLFEKWIGGNNSRPGIAEAAKPGTGERQGRPRILIRRRGARGDVLMLSPVVRALRKKYPESPVVVETDCPDVLAGNPDVDRVEGRIRRPSDFDLTFEPRYEEDPGANAIDVMARQCGVTLESRKMSIALSQNHIAWARSKMKGEMCIAAHTGKSWKSREWPIERFREVFKYYAGKGYSVLELGDKNTVLTGIGGDFRRCSIKQAAALIRESLVFVGIDSVCANLAKAVGTPACIIYGCVDPASRKADALEYPIWVDDLECKGCRNRTSAEHVDCVKQEIYCLTRVRPEMVIEAVQRFIE